MKHFLRISSIALAFCMLISAMPAAFAETKGYADAHTIVLSSKQYGDGSFSHAASLDGENVPEYDYTWHADPAIAHNEVKNAPAEYYTGTAPTGEDGVYIAHDIFYYPMLPADGFKKLIYDGEQEWCYYYTAEGYTNRIFATLPVQGNTVPTEMMHTPEEAYTNAVLHITQPGTYILEGTWHGQIWIDPGDEDQTFSDKNAKVTLVLNGADVTCTVAPALVFYSVYECDNGWEDKNSHTKEIDLNNAGARVIIAHGTVNNFEGTNIYRMLRTNLKDENDTSSVPVQKKQRKTDGAFYSYCSMVIDGEENGTGVLNITSAYEGLGTELHLGINGGKINIYSDNDGINVNEDGVSVAQINGGEVHIIAGLGSEGDGIDSNGYLVINGGTVISMANPAADSGMDSDFGSYVNGGTVASFGSAMDWAKADDAGTDGQAVMNLQFAASQNADEAVIITDTSGKIIFAYDPDKDEVAETRIRSYRGAVISCSELKVGNSYNVYIGGDITGSEKSGVYDITTVTDFSGGVMQCYSGNTVGGIGGTPGRGGRGEVGTFPNGGTMPDISGIPQMPGTPGGNTVPQMPQTDQGNNTAVPDTGSMTRPDTGHGNWGHNSFTTCLSPTDFEISEKASAFSGVSGKGSHVLMQSSDGKSRTCSICGKSFSNSSETQETYIPSSPEQTPASSAPSADTSAGTDTADKQSENSISVAMAAVIACMTFAIGLAAGVVTAALIKKK